MNTTVSSKRWGAKGFTLLEVMVASTISIAVIGGVLSIFYLTGRSLYDLYPQTRARSYRQTALNQIRLRLCDARIDSYSILDNGRKIQYIDPTISGSPTSEFYFTTATTGKIQGELFYDTDINASPNAGRVASGPINITFSSGSPSDPGDPAMITVYVKTAEPMSLGDVDERDGETVVYLRNP
ncbi:MAG: PulJ/GspJ family protein [Candidatus Sumerlaeota bacterium]